MAAELQKSLKACCVSSMSVVLVLLWLRASSMAAEPDGVPVGVILDLNSTFGSKVNRSLTFAIEDYYSANNRAATKIELVVQDVPRNDVVAAERAAYHLIKNRTVRAILGPQNSEQARFVVELGEKYQVPVIWFPITGPSLLPPPSPSSIYSDQGLDCFQFQAIAEVIEALGWQSIIPIYEDTEYGSHLVPCLSNVLKDMGIRMANVTAVDSDSSCGEINDTLLQLKDMRTHVFLVHMSMDLGARFVFFAEEQNMMGEGYAWILTQELSSLTDPRVNTTRRLYYNQTTYRNITVSVALKRYMQGALGVRPMDLISKKTTIRWEKEKNFTNRFRTTLTIYGWWAYHTIEVLAKVVKQGTDNGIKLRSKDIQEAANFKSQSGVNFNLSDGRLYQSELEVYNVIGDRERIIGCWSPKTRLVQNCSKGSSTSDGEYPLKHPLWPGDTLDKPPKLRIGVPKTNSFPEFVNAYNLSKLQIDSGGFAVNVFLKAVQVLPFLLNNYEFVRLDDTGMTFDDLLCDQLLKVKDLDAIIGDITIVENRTGCVDFTLPYLDSRVAMVVRVKKATTSKWILLKPFNWLLWLILVAIFMGATIIIIILESNKNTKGSEGRKKTEEFYYNPFLVYKIDAMEKLKSRAAGWMVILTSFLFILVVQVYTASLTSMLTQGKMKVPSFENEKELIKNSNLHVGYRDGSWVRGLLIEQIGFKPEQLKPLRGRVEYNRALSNGTIDAIFDETPYLTLFLSKYKSQFMMTGPLYKTGGFAFAFPKKSSLVLHFSNAILKVIQDVELYRMLMAKSSLPTSIEDLEFEDQSDIETSSLSIANFGGLYPVLSSLVALSLGLSIISPSVIKRSLNPLPVIRWLLGKLSTLKKLVIDWLRNKKQHFKLVKA